MNEDRLKDNMTIVGDHLDISVERLTLLLKEHKDARVGIQTWPKPTVADSIVAELFDLTALLQVVRQHVTHLEAVLNGTRTAQPITLQEQCNDLFERLRDATDGGLLRFFKDTPAARYMAEILRGMDGH